MRISKHIKSLFIAGAILISTSLSAGAISLNFAPVQGNNGPTLLLPEVEINALSTGSTVLVGPSAAGETDGFCFLSSTDTCASLGEMIFTSPVNNLSFDIDLFAPGGDALEIFINNGTAFLGSIIVTASGNLDLSGFGTLTQLFFNDTSSGDGAGFSTFSFNSTNLSVVPLPASLPLYGTGLALLGFLGWRKKRKAAV